MDDTYLYALGSNYQSVDFEETDGYIPSLIVYVPKGTTDKIDHNMLLVESIEVIEASNVAKLHCSQDKTETMYTLHLSLAHIGLITTFSDSPVPLDILIYEEDFMYTMENGEVLDEDDCVGVITFPPLGSKGLNDIITQISDTINLTRTIPMSSNVKKVLAPIPKKARGLVFSILAGLAIGKQSSFYEMDRLYTLMSNLDQRDRGETQTIPEVLLADTLKEHDELLAQCSTAIVAAYAQSEDFLERTMKYSLNQNDEMSDEDMKFLDILTNEGILDKLDKINLKETDTRSLTMDTIQPLYPLWPEQMRDLETTFKNKDYPPALSDFLAGKDFPDTIDIPTEVLGYALTIAGRATRLVESLRNSNEQGGTTTVLLLFWLNGEEEDESSWELPAFTSDLVHYDTTAFSDLLASSLSSEDNIESAFWLQSVSVGLIKFMLENSLNPEEFFLHMSESDIKPDMEAFMSTIGGLINEFFIDLVERAQVSQEIHISMEELNEYVVQYFYEITETDENINLNMLAENCAAAIPVLADKMSENLSLGSQEWKEHRVEFVHNFLEYCGRDRKILMMKG